MELLIFFIALTILAFAANIWGTNTLDSRDWFDHSDLSGRPGHHL